jgi:undecaprenyl-diphosphatase
MHRTLRHRSRSRTFALIACISALTVCGTVRAAGGPLGIDYELRYDNAGIWKRTYQLDLEYAVLGTSAVGALWLGNADPLGHVFWQDIDAEAISAIAAQGLKYAVSRARPSQGDNPNSWFQGQGHQGFPSGEVTLQAAFVTPIIVNYVHQSPWIAALEVLPIYDAIGRMKLHEHWQSDVIASWLLGTGVGYWTSTLKVPLVVRVLPGGVSVGVSRNF